MPNRVIKDSIWTSPTLAKLPNYIQDQWTRWLLMADDWGCFNADPQIIKGLIYPKRNESINKIIKIRNDFEEAGLLFVWNNSEREWGFFVSWDNHQFCNASGVDNEGKYTKHRRKTPIPPKDLYDKYSDKFQQVPTKSLKPKPKPNPKPIYIHVLNFWNLQEKLPTHSTEGKIWDDIKEAINGRLTEKKTEKDIIHTIENYSKIINGKEYYFNYRWTLPDFLQRGFEKFKDWEIAKSNYTKENKESKWI